ncbi:AtpZ/AtpI family protein [Veillonella agrestimuris]|uniref:AtpZ/AtpI family protein n=1 Tax=Veillonella agrestimuris TaxID=2941340 RepID=UPI00204015C3|nr:AtpZ/AtpI family protein [Veillonella agrestimuris]
MDKQLLKSLAVATSAGTTFLACIGGFVWIGYQIDTWLDTTPMCMALLGLIGAVTGFYMMYKQLKQVK